MRCGRVLTLHGKGLKLLVRNTCVVLQNEASMFNEAAIDVVGMILEFVGLNPLNIGAPESKGGRVMAADLGAAKKLKQNSEAASGGATSVCLRSEFRGRCEFLHVGRAMGARRWR
ncbi:uncharacterized protein MONOS_5550 [Monocercomonoides exilis]|uniref:uncharacterized protein n=1 Tax=Monocercomonoides exilis TaxID=2049356 RepID=UPI0035596871|nr:hypothetical protein MONOS_5550 [Monocercomonoides exilis]|eukprot:MONOS_5550.1-p1 / transcript=MONOS_5550.1 / gene=MONOS_5550 / organism=Monocercomonoides_exilis_PA203 / gene_product=unspecified product / transcript_product=unspecified product / location=Mono_scaffold00163:16174-16518(-) / protein_length=115 / sequence_SO=supercontig / SO=protein_coding / is_pseudo=false